MEIQGKPDPFPPTDEAWRSRLQSLDPQRYAATRNHLLGSVSRLSPYLTHGFVSLGEAVDAIRSRTRLHQDDKLFAEFAWRSFYHHVWAHKGEAIFEDLRPAIPNVRYTTVLPTDIREGQTGLPVIDQAISTLYSAGYLHNHARMWLASYVVHLRHIHWRVAADWMYGHLLDGDLASNHLSWQWVASTFSTKPYLFNAENVSKYAPVAWHSEETPLSTSYESLELMALGHAESDRAKFLKFEANIKHKSPALEEPWLYDTPPASILTELECPFLEGSLTNVGESNSIELVHPWGLRAESLVVGVEAKKPYRLGVIHLPSRARWPWSHRRWHFVLKRMASLCDAMFIGNARDLANLLPKNKTYYLVNNLGAQETQSALSDLNPTMLQPPTLFEEPEYFCQSFSKYFRSVTERKPDHRGAS